jgi:hypothetical protein
MIGEDHKVHGRNEKYYLELEDRGRHFVLEKEMWSENVNWAQDTSQGLFLRGGGRTFEFHKHGFLLQRNNYEVRS